VQYSLLEKRKQSNFTFMDKSFLQWRWFLVKRQSNITERALSEEKIRDGHSYGRGKGIVKGL
jgi:hypothetical protein